jgi:hypothetical protein
VRKELNERQYDHVCRAVASALKPFRAKPELLAAALRAIVDEVTAEAWELFSPEHALDFVAHAVNDMALFKQKYRQDRD